MSSESTKVVHEHETQSSNSVVTYRPLEENAGYIVHYISPTFAKIEHLKTGWNAEHQHEKHTMVELNDRFSSMLDRIQRLQSKNEKFAAKVAELRRKAFIASITGKQSVAWRRMYADLIDTNNDKFSIESEIELFEQQIQMYEPIVQNGQQWIDEERFKLEEEYNHSAATLADLRVSHTILKDEVTNIRKKFKDLLCQYVATVKEWSVSRTQAKESRFALHALQIQIKFTKELYAYVMKFKNIQIVYIFSFCFAFIVNMIFSRWICLTMKNSEKLNGNECSRKYVMILKDCIVLFINKQSILMRTRAKK